MKTDCFHCKDEIIILHKGEITDLYWRYIIATSTPDTVDYVNKIRQRIEFWIGEKLDP